MEKSNISKTESENPHNYYPKRTLLPFSAPGPEFQLEDWELGELSRSGINKLDLDYFLKMTELREEQLQKIVKLNLEELEDADPLDIVDDTISENIIRLSVIYGLGYSLFDDWRVFNRWMLTSNKTLGYNTPLERCAYTDGFWAVHSLLNRMEWTFYRA